MLNMRNPIEFECRDCEEIKEHSNHAIMSGDPDRGICTDCCSCSYCDPEGRARKRLFRDFGSRRASKRTPKKIKQDTTRIYQHPNGAYVYLERGFQMAAGTFIIEVDREDVAQMLVDAWNQLLRLGVESPHLNRRQNPGARFRASVWDKYPAKYLDEWEPIVGLAIAHGAIDFGNTTPSVHGFIFPSMNAATSFTGALSRAPEEGFYTAKIRRTGSGKVAVTVRS